MVLKLTAHLSHLETWRKKSHIPGFHSRPTKTESLVVRPGNMTFCFILFFPSLPFFFSISLLLKLLKCWCRLSMAWNLGPFGLEHLEKYLVSLQGHFCEFVPCWLSESLKLFFLTGDRSRTLLGGQLKAEQYTFPSSGVGVDLPSSSQNYGGWLTRTWFCTAVHSSSACQWDTWNLRLGQILLRQ